MEPHTIYQEVVSMYYENLQQLIRNSNSTRRYFLSLPVEVQMDLHGLDADIHSAQELHQQVYALQNYRRHLQLGRWKE